MILYLLLVIFCVLMTLISIGFLIGGLVKKKKNLWLGGLISSVFFIMITVYAGYTYVGKQLDYMGSEEFQEKTVKTAENWGKNIGNTVSGAAKGLESTLDDEAITALAKKSSTIVGHGVKAISTGLDESIGKTTVFSDESLEKYSIAIGRAEEMVDSRDYKFGLFVEFDKDIAGELTLTSYDSEGLKSDKSSMEISEKAGNSGVKHFHFKNFNPGFSGYCILSFKESILSEDSDSL